MIKFEDVEKTYHLGKFHNQVLKKASFEIPFGSSIGICGANGAGKSTLMRMIAGVEYPSRGKIVRNMTTSWPIGYTSCFQSSLTGADNARFIARIYNRKIEPLLAYVEDFAQLGPYFHQPISTYSAGMNARLAFGISLAIDFDCYLVDEVTSAGDERFRQRCEEALHHRRDNGTLIMISHDPGVLATYCDTGIVLNRGDLTFYDTIAEAVEVHHLNQATRIVVGAPPESKPSGPLVPATTERLFPDFATDYYLAIYPDVEKARLVAEDHWTKFGRTEVAEGRRYVAPDFLEDSYLSDRPDVAAAVAAGLWFSGYDHWLCCGHTEARCLVPVADGAGLT